MNVYDFDKTIYCHDSSVDFYLYCLKKHPRIIKHLPKQLIGAIKYGIFHTINKTQLKDYLYQYFESLDDIDSDIQAFWDVKIKGIFPYYLNNKREDDLIITASPVKLVEVGCHKIGQYHVLGSLVDMKTGKTLGPNCDGQQKVIAFNENGYKKEDVESFYSDSYNDEPLALLAKKAYHINKGKVEDWDFKK